MCTVLFHNELGLLCKNRDKDSVAAEEVVTERDYIGVRTKGSDYFSLGLNRHGIAFVSTAVNPSEWINAIEKGEREKAGKILSDLNRGLERPTGFISEQFSRIDDKESFVQKFSSAGIPWMAYNVVLADVSGAVHLEIFRNQVKVRKLAQKEVVTNHFFSIGYGPRACEDYPSSFNRYEIAGKELAKADSPEQIKDILSAVSTDKDKAIWRSGAFLTVSGTIVSIKDKSVIYKGRADNGWEKYRL